MLNLFKAMREAQKNGVAHVRNKKGNAFLAVRKVTNVKGRISFQVLDSKGNNLAYILRTWLNRNNKMAAWFGCRIVWDYEIKRA